MTAQICAEHARAGTLATALLAEPLAFHQTLSLMLDDRVMLFTEFHAAMNHRSPYRLPAR